MLNLWLGFDEKTDRASQHNYDSSISREFSKAEEVCELGCQPLGGLIKCGLGTASLNIRGTVQFLTGRARTVPLSPARIGVNGS